MTRPCLIALRRAGAGWAEAEVREIGRLAGTARAQNWGRLANENPPVLHAKIVNSYPQDA
jgi:putative acyl-CoA dehydrogenase